MAKKPAKTQPAFAAGRARQSIASRFNPIRGLTPARLVSFMDAWDHGFLRNAAESYSQIAERDDQVVTCSTKRVRGPARLNYEILQVDDSPEAERDAGILTAFYNNIEVTHTLDADERGGVRLLVKQMLSCIGMRYAVHEIVWRPSPSGLSAEFRFVPLAFFERTAGKLRFLMSDLAVEGVPLEPGGWMVTVGDGLMKATAIAYMFKTMPLKSWVSFCEKYGVPGLHGTTSAAKDTPEWQAMADALAHFGEDLALLTNEGAKITPITVAQSGSQPHQPLVERMDRAISRIWLGGDLATMSAGQQAVGSEAQTGDLDNLEEDDANHVTETLNYYVDAEVIRLRTGSLEPKAYFRLIPKPRLAVDRDVKRIEAAQKFGVPISRKYVRQVLALPEPLEGEELLRELAPAPAFPGGQPFPGMNPALANELATSARQEIFRAQALRDIALAKSEALRPLRDRLVEILGMDDEQMDVALLKLQNDAPQILRDRGATSAEIDAWTKVFATGVASGAIEAAQRPTSAR